MIIPSSYMESDNVFYKASGGGSVIRTVDDKLNDSVFVEDFGAMGDGTTDDAAAIQAAINAVTARGGGVVFFTSSVYRIESGLTCTGNNVMLVGAGAGYNRGGAGNDYDQAATTIIWYGSAGGTMLDFGPANGANYGLKGGGCTGIYFEGRGVAGRCLYAHAIYSTEWDIVCSEATTAAFTVDQDGSLLVDPGTSQTNYFKRITVINQTPSSGKCVVVTGDATYNASLNRFGMLKLLHYNGTALECGSSDGNLFEWTSVYRHPSGTGIGVELLAGATTDQCRKNTFVFLQAGAGGLTARGTASGAAPSDDNAVLYYSRGNSTPAPTIEAGAGFYYFDSDGKQNATAFYQGGNSAAMISGYALSIQAANIATLNDGDSLYFGSLSGLNPTTAAGYFRVYIPKTGVIKWASIWSFSNTAGSNEDWSLYVRLNNTTDTLIATVGAAAQLRHWTNNALSIAVSAGDYIEIKSVNPTWGTNPANTRFGGHIWLEES